MTAPPRDADTNTAALERVLASQTFGQVERLKRFLEFIARETIEGRGDRLKEYVIGVQVFDKEQTFDPRADPIVRVQARRLRARLERYYAEESPGDDTVIELPKGRYEPAFRKRDARAGQPRALSLTLTSHNSVAVDAFSDLSEAKDLAHVAEGLRAEIIHRLTRVRSLQVLGWKPDEPNGFRRETPPAAFIVSGSVRKSPASIRITATVMSGSTGSYLASESIDASLDGLLAAEERIAAFVEATIRPSSADGASAPRRERPSENLAARNLYLQGRYHLAQRTEEGLLKAVEFFEGALKEDPEYALAHSGVADAYGLLTNYGVRGPADVWTKAASHAASGVMLDPQAVETRTTLAHVKAIQDWDWTGAEQEYLAAISISPDYATAHHWYAVSCLMPLGRLDQAMKEMSLAQALDPVSPIVARDIALLHLYQRNYDAALEQCDHTVSLNPHFSPAYQTLALIQEQRQDLDESVAAIHRAIDLAPNSPRMRAALARALALAGRREQALQILKQVEELAKRRYVSRFDFALARFALGQDDLAFRWLNRARKDRAFEMTSLNADPRFDPVRADPRFRAIVKSIGLG